VDDRGDPCGFEDARRHFADHCSQMPRNDGSGKTERASTYIPVRRICVCRDSESSPTVNSIHHRNGGPADRNAGLGRAQYARRTMRVGTRLFIRHLPKLTAEELKTWSTTSRGEMEREEEKNRGCPNAGTPQGNPPQNIIITSANFSQEFVVAVGRSIACSQ